MPKYKLVLTVQDSYGMTKEIEAGTVDAADYELTDKDLRMLDKTFATDAEVAALISGNPVEKPDDFIQPEPEEPDQSERPGDDDSGFSPTPDTDSVLKYILENKSAIYSQDSSGNLDMTEFKAVTWSSTEAEKEHKGESIFYVILDDLGEVIEYGYQEVTEPNDEAWLTIALPYVVNKVSVKMFDKEANRWSPVTFKLESTGEQVDDNIIWTVPEKYEIPSGGTYRFVIEE